MKPTPHTRNAIIMIHLKMPALFVFTMNVAATLYRVRTQHLQQVEETPASGSLEKVEFLHNKVEVEEGDHEQEREDASRR